MVDAKPDPIALPADFPVEWDSPEDAGRFWSRDPTHFPSSLPLLALEFVSRCQGGGMNRAFEHYGRPIRMHRIRVNCYIYNTVRTVVPPAEIAAAAREGEQNTLEAWPEIWDRWETEWMPEVQAHLSWWENFDLPGASVTSLRDHLSESIERSVRCWHMHFVLAPLITGAGSAFMDLYTDLFGEGQYLEAPGLTLAEDNKSLETDRELWKLSQRLRNADDGAVLVESGSDDDLRNELGRSLDDFLLKYGHRSGDGSGFAGLSWFENPDPVLAMVRAYGRSDSPDPAEEHASLIIERDRVIAIARGNLEGYPQEVRDQFDKALLLAQQSSRLQEDHAFWIDQQSLVRTHYVATEAGRRLAGAGVIDDPADVFHLSFEEVLNALDGLMSGDTDDKSDVIRDRVADLEYWSQIQGHLEIGVRPANGPPESVSSRGLTRFIGDGITQGDDPSLVNGNPASHGSVEGIARIVKNISEFGRLSPGEILVAPTTSPPWTPLFHVAAAVVTDAGGVLSHCAVVAREYGIPAIVGTGVGTARIKDGQRIRVDGDAGVIRILD